MPALPTLSPSTVWRNNPCSARLPVHLTDTSRVAEYIGVKLCLARSNYFDFSNSLTSRLGSRSGQPRKLGSIHERTVVHLCQLCGSLRVAVVRHNHRRNAVVDGCPGDYLLDCRAIDRPRLPLTLDRRADIVPGRDEINPEIAGCPSHVNVIAQAAQYRGDIVFEFNSGHLINCSLARCSVEGIPAGSLTMLQPDNPPPPHTDENHHGSRDCQHPNDVVEQTDQSEQNSRGNPQANPLQSSSRSNPVVAHRPTVATGPDRRIVGASVNSGFLKEF